MTHPTETQCEKCGLPKRKMVCSSCKTESCAAGELMCEVANVSDFSFISHECTAPPQEPEKCDKDHGHDHVFNGDGEIKCGHTCCKSSPSPSPTSEEELEKELSNPSGSLFMITPHQKTVIRSLLSKATEGMVPDIVLHKQFQEAYNLGKTHEREMHSVTVAQARMEQYEACLKVIQHQVLRAREIRHVNFQTGDSVICKLWKEPLEEALKAIESTKPQV